MGPCSGPPETRTLPAPAADPPPAPSPSARVMGQTSLEFLQRLLDSPGPSGFETAPARVWREEVSRLADEVRTDTRGNTVAVLNPGGAPRLMCVGHIDEIGLQITHIDDEGFVYFAAIGGWDPQVLVGQRVVIITRRGPVTGVIGKKAIHVMKPDERDKVSKIQDLWIDVGAAEKKEAAGMVRVGDAAVLESRAQLLPNGRIVSRSIDNRIGTYVVAEALRLLAADRTPKGNVLATAHLAAVMAAKLAAFLAAIWPAVSAWP